MAVLLITNRMTINFWKIHDGIYLFIESSFALWLNGQISLRQCEIEERKWDQIR